MRNPWHEIRGRLFPQGIATEIHGIAISACSFNASAHRDKTRILSLNLKSRDLTVSLGHTYFGTDLRTRQRRAAFDFTTTGCVALIFAD